MSFSTPLCQNITLSVMHSKGETTDYPIEGSIDEITIDGQKVLQIHELAVEITKLQKTYNMLCVVSGTAFIALLISFLKLVPDPDRVNQHMDKVDQIHKKTVVLKRALIGNESSTGSSSIDE